MPNAVQLTAQRLIGCLRVADKLTAHSDHIRIAGRQNFLCLHGVIDPPERNHRNLDRFFQCSRHIDAEPHRDIVVRDFKIIVTEAAGIAVDIVHAGLLQRNGHLYTVVPTISPLRKLIHTEPDTDRVVFTDCRTNRLNDLNRVAHPIFKAAAILIGSLVQIGRDKRPQQAVMRNFQLYAVKSPFLFIDRRLHIIPLDLLHFFEFKLLRVDVTVRPRHLRRRIQQRRPLHTRRMATVIKLPKDLPAVFVDFRRHKAEHLLIAWIMRVDHRSPHLTSRRDALRHANQSRAALGALNVVIGEPFRRQAVLPVTVVVAEICPVRQKNDSVLQRHTAKLNRRKQPSKLLVLHNRHPFSSGFCLKKAPTMR